MSLLLFRREAQTGGDRIGTYIVRRGDLHHGTKETVCAHFEKS